MISATQIELASIWKICSGISSFRFCPQNAPKQTKKGSIIFVVGKSPMDIMEPILL